MRLRKRPIYHCLFGLDDAVVGGVLGLAGDFLGASMAQSAQGSAIAANKEMQQRNIDWEREQLQNKHQWEVGDLRRAGLNPILSATTGSSAVSAGTPSATPVKPDLQISRTLEAIAHSSLMKKQQESVDYQNETERIKAEADMLRSKQEEARTNSIIGANEAQASLYNMSADQIKQLTPLKVAYEKANIKKTEQDILNSVIEVRNSHQPRPDLINSPAPNKIFGSAPRSLL